MTRKFFLCLALVLCGGLSGHATENAVTNLELKVVKVDNEETVSENGSAANAVDGDPNTYWHTRWHTNSTALPHEIVIELAPPAVITGFTYLPRQDLSDHGTIKDFEFYVSDDGRHFGQPIKKGTFDPGKGEKVETFNAIKCRFIKLQALSEITGQPWTSAAEIRVIQNGEVATNKDYWRGDIGTIPVTDLGLVPVKGQDTKRPDAIDAFVEIVSKSHGLWANGIDSDQATKATTPQEVVAETLHAARFNSGLMTSYWIVSVREVHIDGISYTAALVGTNLGDMIVLMQFTEDKGPTPGHWWRRVYDTSPWANRLY